jgi:hypothetical protein
MVEKDPLHFKANGEELVLDFSRTLWSFSFTFKCEKTIKSLKIQEPAPLKWKGSKSLYGRIEFRKTFSIKYTFAVILRNSNKCTKSFILKK